MDSKIIENNEKCFSFNLETADNLSRQPDLNENEKHTISKKLGICHAIASIKYYHTGKTIL